MEQEQSVRALIAQQLGVEVGDINELPLVDVALALQEALGVTLPRPHLLRLGSYGELLRALHDALSVHAAGRNLGTCFVRARVVAGGADGRVMVVRVGWLTPDLAAAIADDVRSAPSGTWLDVLVPPDVADGELLAVQRGLRALIDSQVELDVRRIGDPPAPTLSRIATGACGRLPQREAVAGPDTLTEHDAGSGTPLADSRAHTTCLNRRRSGS